MKRVMLFKLLIEALQAFWYRDITLVFYVVCDGNWPLGFLGGAFLGTSMETYFML